MADEPKPERTDAGKGGREKRAAGVKPPAEHAPPKPAPTMAAVPWESDLTKMLKEQFGDDISEFSSYLGQNFLVCKSAAVIPILEYLKLEGDFDYLVDITAVDYPKRPERFDLCYILYSFARNERVRIKTAVADGAKPATSTTVYATSNWIEREGFDMFGIQFSGHPDMRRILLPEEWEGF